MAVLWAFAGGLGPSEVFRWKCRDQQARVSAAAGRLKEAAPPREPGLPSLVSDPATLPGLQT